MQLVPSSPSLRRGPARESQIVPRPESPGGSLPEVLPTLIAVAAWSSCGDQAVTDTSSRCSSPTPTIEARVCANIATV